MPLTPPGRPATLEQTETSETRLVHLRPSTAVKLHPPSFRSLACFGLLGGVAGVLLWPSVRPGRVLLPTESLQRQAPYASTAGEPHRSWNALQWDALAQYYPWRVFARRWLRRGVLPLWNPHEFCGMPFVANAQSAVFYPPNLLFWLMDPASAFGWLALLRFLTAGGFTFLLARSVGLGRHGSLFAGLAYAFSGFLVTWTALPTLVDVALWLPWVLWSLERIHQGHPTRGCVALGLGLGAQFLAGHPHMSVYLLLAVGLRVAFMLRPGKGGAPRRTAPLAWVAAGLVLGLATGGCQLLPTAELSRFSHRFHGGTPPPPLGRANPQALPWQQVSLLVSPRFLGDPNAGTYYGFAWARGNYADYCGYTGAVTLVLAAVGCVTAGGAAPFWMALAGLGLVLAWNPYPLAWLLSRSTVTAATLGSPTRAFILLSLGLALLAGYGVDAVTRLRPEQRVRIGVAATCSSALWLVLLLGLRGAIDHRLAQINGQILSFAQPLQTLAVLGSGALLLLSGGLVAAAGTRRLSPRCVSGLLVGLLMVDLLWFGSGYNPAGKRTDVYPPAPILTWLQQQAPGQRVLALNRRWSLTDYPPGCLPPNGAMVFGLDEVAGYDSLHLARYRTLAAALQQANPSPPENGNMILLDNFASPLVPRLGVRYLLSRVALDLPATHLRRTDGAFLYEVSRPFPRAFETTHPLPRDLSSLRPELIPWSYRRPDPNRLTVSGAAPVPGTVVVTDTNFPGWRAAASGGLLRVDTAFGMFRAVALPPGVRRVTFVYDPQSVRLGLFLTLLGLSALTALGAQRACRRRPRLRRR